MAREQSNFPGLKDPRKQSALGRMADRDVELGHAREWSRERMAQQRKLNDAEAASRYDGPVFTEGTGVTREQRGAKFKDAMERGIVIGTGAPAIAAAGLIPMGLRAGLLAQTPGALMVDAVNNDVESGGVNTALGGLAALGPAALPAVLATLATYPEEAQAGVLRRLYSGLSTPNKLNRAFYATTDPHYASKRALQKSKPDDPMFVHTLKADDDKLIQFGRSYDTRSAPEAFSNFPRGERVSGEDIYAALKPLADEHSDHIVKSLGYAGHERPNTGDFGKGQWFRIASPDDIDQSFAKGGLARVAARMGSEAAPARKGVSDVIKEKGGNWLTGSVEDALKGLKRSRGLSVGDLEAELPELPPQIKQIKGKQNRAPNEEYLPFVQDFVRSGKWSDVGDIQNSGLLKHSSGYLTKDELGKLVNEGDMGAMRLWQHSYIDR